MLKGTTSKYKRNVVILMIFGMLFYYVQCVFSALVMNILTTQGVTATGWTATQMTGPVSIASILGIVIGFFAMTLLAKYNTKVVAGVFMSVIGIATLLMGVAFAVNNYTLYYITFFIIRLIYAVPSFAVSAFCGNWFLKSRGTALGIVTIGAPLASATFVAMSTGLIAKFGIHGTFVGLGVAILIIGILSMLLLTNSPEDIGENVDGGSTALVIAEDEGDITVKQVLTSYRGWLSAIAFAILTFAMVCMAAFFVAIMSAKGYSPAIYLPAMSIGAVLGVPISYLLGWLDDKFGTPKACIALGVLSIIGFVGMMTTNGVGLFPVVIGVLGYASMSGGTPNLQSSLNFYVYGKKNFLRSYRLANIPSLVLAAFAPNFMAAKLQAGQLNQAFTILIIATLVAIVCFIIIGAKPSYDDLNK